MDIEKVIKKRADEKMQEIIDNIENHVYDYLLAHPERYIPIAIIDHDYYHPIRTHKDIEQNWLPYQYENDLKSLSYEIVGGQLELCIKDERLKEVLLESNEKLGFGFQITPVCIKVFYPIPTISMLTVPKKEIILSR